MSIPYLHKSTFDSKIFVENIETLLDIHFGGRGAWGAQTEFNNRIGDRDAITKWKRGERPSLEVLLRIRYEFKVSLEWLLFDNKE